LKNEEEEEEEEEEEVPVLRVYILHQI